MPTTAAEPSKRLALPLLLLAVATAIVYAPALRNGFITNYDDDLYVTGNATVQQGLTADGIAWAFTTGFAANWHPLTWLSHMIDYEIFGSAAWGHHLTSVLFHIANTLLLAYVLFRLTKRTWPSVVVAALFALHPLHVESVAWIAERKDVLSTLFWLLAMLAYLRYVEQRTFQRYTLIAITLMLGLMAKPMLVTLPCVFLLLDYWPLNRFSLDRQGITKTFPKLFAEKLPLFAIVALSSAVTFYVQNRGTAVVSVDAFPMSVRLGNAALAYVAYIGKTFVPLGLAAYYPHPGSGISFVQAGVAAAALVVVTLLTVLSARRAPYLLVGWLWFVGTLVPVIGIVQVGNQAYADRYTYVPLIGFFLALVRLCAESASTKPRRRAVTVLAVLALLVCTAATRQLIPTWKDGETVFQRAIAVTDDNALAHNNLAIAYLDKKDFKNAEEHAKRAIAIRPTYADAHYNLAKVYADQEKYEAALEAFQRAAELAPRDPETQNNLGLTLARLGRLEEAIPHYQAALEADPDLVNAYVNLGVAYRESNLPNEAMQTYLSGLERAPNSPNLHNNLATLLARHGKYDKAAYHFEQAIALQPDYIEVRYNYAMMLGAIGQTQAARQQLETLLQYDPNFQPAQQALQQLDQ